MAMVSSRPLDTIQYNSAPVQVLYRDAHGSLFVPGRIFKLVEIPVLYKVSLAPTPTSPIHVQAPAPALNPPPAESSLPVSAPILEPEPSPEYPTLPAPELSPTPSPLPRIPVSTRPPGTPHHRQVDSEILDGEIEAAPRETAQPSSTEATTSDENNFNNVNHEHIVPPTNPPHTNAPPSLIHHS